MSFPLALLPSRPGRWFLAGLLALVAPLGVGCAGDLEGDFSSINARDGGATGSGGSVAATGGTVGSGGATGSGGMVSTGGVTATGTGGATGAAGKSGSGGATGAAGKSGSGGATGAAGKSGSGGAAGRTGAGSGGRSGAATGGTTGSGGSGTMASCDAPTMVFQDATVGCLGGGCHSSGAGNQKPDLGSANPGSALKGTKATILCSGGDMVVPSKPTSSVLYEVVAGMSCGVQMPLGKPTLSQAQLDCLAAWIANIQ